MVQRCVCYDVTFERLRQIAESTGGGLLEAHRRTGCGSRCGLCLPYILLALRTGQDALPVMWSDEFRSLGIAPGTLAKLEKLLTLQEPTSQPA